MEAGPEGVQGARRTAGPSAPDRGEGVSAPGPELFERLYGGPPAFRVRAPGRVNLIGEHTDYNGLPVLPMAIQRRITLLARPTRGPRVRIASRQAGYEPRAFELAEEIEPFAPGDWGNYPKAAGRALARELGELAGFDGVVDSDLPVASGLSSSSALVVACALALLRANDRDLEPLRLAALMAAGERYVGLRGGGMDQAVCLAGREDAALRIDFEPLEVNLCPVPDGWRFIVADSLVEAPKSAGARETYNRRTEECREALAQAARHLDVAAPSYRILMRRFSVEELLQVAESDLDEVLSKRFRHVVTEGARVEAAQRALREADPERFGRLMGASHRSLREDYEVSTAELDALVEIAHAAGAAGARLTGAGMGGCALALTTADRVRGVLTALVDRFYTERPLDGELEDHLFVAHPSAGASVQEL